MSNSEFNIIKRIVLDSLEDLKTLDIENLLNFEHSCFDLENYPFILYN